MVLMEIAVAVALLVRSFVVAIDDIGVVAASMAIVFALRGAELLCVLYKRLALARVGLEAHLEYGCPPPVTAGEGHL